VLTLSSVDGGGRAPVLPFSDPPARFSAHHSSEPDMHYRTTTAEVRRAEQAVRAVDCALLLKADVVAEYTRANIDATATLRI